jgi:hypothetical protein
MMGLSVDALLAKWVDFVSYVAVVVVRVNFSAYRDGKVRTCRINMSLILPLQFVYPRLPGWQPYYFRECHV